MEAKKSRPEVPDERVAMEGFFVDGNGEIVHVNEAGRRIGYLARGAMEQPLCGAHRGAVLRLRFAEPYQRAHTTFQYVRAYRVEKKDGAEIKLISLGDVDGAVRLTIFVNDDNVQRVEWELLARATAKIPKVRGHIERREGPLFDTLEDV